VVQEKVGRYIQEAASTDEGPCWYVAPYFYFRDPCDPWYKACLRAQSAAREACPEAPKLLPVVFTDASTLADKPSREQLLGDYGTWPSPALVLWVDNLRQSDATPSAVRALRGFCRDLLDRYDKRVLLLYGGFMPLLLAGSGVAGVCHGLFYGEHKARVGVPPAGPPPDRYYVPHFHDFRMMSHAIRIMQEAPEATDLVCHCPVCEPLLQGDPARLPLMWESGALKRHFLHVRKTEKEHIPSQPLEAHVVALRETYARYHKLVAAIPNPESESEPAPLLPGLEYLKTWADGLSGAPQ
jgi:hypothetical protein